MVPENYSESTTVGYFERIKNSFIGVLVGIVLFFASFWILWMNEGRLDYSKVAKSAVEIKSDQPNEDKELLGKLVSTSGPIKTEQEISDNLFLKSGKYIALQRVVKVYCWVETKHETREKNIGGSETIKTTYSYDKKWENIVPDSSKFKIPEGHQNEAKEIEDLFVTAKEAKIGIYSIDLEKLDLVELKELNLSKDNTKLSKKAQLKEIEKEGNNKKTKIYIPKSSGNTFEKPGIGDIKICYNVLPQDEELTIFAKLSADNKLTTFNIDNKHGLYRLFYGTKENAVLQMHSEYSTMSWFLRLVGFLCMWVGMILFLGPISTLLDILPILGNITGFMILFVTFPIAFVISLITIIIAIIAHNIYLLLAVLALIIGSVIYFSKKRKKEKIEHIRKF